MQHARGFEHVRAHVVHVARARGALDHHAEQRVAERRVRELRAGLVQERVVLEYLQGRGEGLVMRRPLTLARLVMTNATEMTEQLAGRGRLGLWRGTPRGFLARGGPR